MLCSLASASLRGYGQLLFSSNLPILIIDTNGQTIRDDPKIIATLKVIDHLPGINSSGDTEFSYDGLIGIELRGSGSQNFPKKPYGFETLSTPEQDVDIPLLGMPSGDDWVLNPVYNDKSLMRDVLAYRLARDQKRYASRTRYCELVLNGSYEGIYVVQEKIERDKFRVNIPKMESSSNSGNAITGGYIIKIDKTTGSGGDGWHSVQPEEGSRVFFQYDYPKPDEISSAQKNYIREYTGDFEKALLDEHFRDTENGYAKYMDVGSMIDFLLVNEVSKNVDGYRISTFLYKKRESDGGRLHMGPVWDFNLGFGNTKYCTGGYPEGYAFNFNDVCPNDANQVPFWWKRVFTDSAFTDALSVRWTSLRNSVYQTGVLHQFIDSVSAVLGANGAIERNFQRWPLTGNTEGETFDESIMFLKNWVTQRMTWLDGHLPFIITAVADEAEPAITVFPNPTGDHIHVMVESVAPSSAELKLMDLFGRIIEVRRVDYTGLTMQVDFDLATLRPGVYFLRSQPARGKAAVVRVVRASP